MKPTNPRSAMPPATPNPINVPFPGPESLLSVLAAAVVEGVDELGASTVVKIVTCSPLPSVVEMTDVTGRGVDVEEGGGGVVVDVDVGVGVLVGVETVVDVEVDVEVEELVLVVRELVVVSSPMTI